MSAITKARARALANVCRLVTAAERHEQELIAVGELRVALEGVDVEGLADPRPPEVINVGRQIGVTVTSHTRQNA